MNQTDPSQGSVSATVLVADDDPNDRALLRYAAAVANPDFVLRFVQNGIEALQFLKGEKPFGERSHQAPLRLVVLDVKMPKMGGLEVLDWLKHSEGFHELKTVILSGYDGPDIAAAVKSAGAIYCRKPVSVEPWVEFIRGLDALLKQQAVEH
ncbi:MAG TPA: response regulator [Verrucomicrobiae bacterium]|nr:response regulator [Verrucomicrobiae bacterium]